MPALQRADVQPPCSSWAEETILSDCLRDPALIDRIGDIGPELVFTEFRAIWRAMVRARMRGVDLAHWYSAVHDELEHSECHDRHDEHWYRAVASERSKGLDTTHPLSAWWSCKAKALLALLNSGSLLPAQFDYALVLLHRCTEARQIIQRAHDVAYRAWRVPDVALGESDLAPMVLRFQAARPTTRPAQQTAATKPPTIWDMDDI